MTRPSAPTSVQIDGHAETGSTIVTKNVDGSVPLSAVIDDPDGGQKVRLVVRYSTNKAFTHYRQAVSTYGPQGVRRTVNLVNLSKNTIWYTRAYTQDKNLTFSATYNSSVFATDRYPLAPNLIAPAENVTVDATDVTVFDWQALDPDETAETVPATGFTIQYRTAGTPLIPPGPWSKVHRDNIAGTSYAMPANTFKKGQVYEWRVRTRDPQNQWGAYSLIRSFTTIGVTKTPIPLSPNSNVGVAVDEDVTFKWRFQDPTPGATQGNADLRYRVVGTSTWILVAGGALTEKEWTFSPGTFLPGYRYEWQVLTYRSTGLDPQSDWSVSAYFWSILTPGSLANVAALLGEEIRGQLGRGKHKVFITDRGGLVRRGEIDKFSALEWNRLRDDISPASLTIDNPGTDLSDLLGNLRSWMHEIVIFRDDEEVFAGPVVHREMRRGQVKIQARDPWAYLYRRILRQGYNDSYRKVDGVQLGLKTITERAYITIVNALAYADPNVLPYLTVIRTGDDARQSSVVPDYTKTAWQDIDDMAANRGLDYTSAGRRLILWDTHVALGRLPEMRDGDFSEPLVLTEYGMSGANFFAVTDGNGAHGEAIPDGKTADNWFEDYGPLEQLASAYGDAAPEAASTDPAALAALQDLLSQQARRNINGRYPVPMAVRVPDNSRILPNVNVTINQLIPGVWIPISVSGTVQKWRQMQKLDSVTVTQEGSQTGATEQVKVVMSPVPTANEDPDATGTDDGGESL